MGMFDHVIIPKSRLLGIDEKIDKYLSLVNQPEVSLQTKELDNSLARYFIRDDSLFYENRNNEWVKNESDSLFRGYLKTISTEMVPHNITATLVCYDYLQTSLLDISIDFKIVIINGTVSEISLFKYEEEDSAPRIERDKELFIKLEKQLAFSKTTLGKCQRRLSKILYKISKIFISIGNAIQRLSFKL